MANNSREGKKYFKEQIINVNGNSRTVNGRVSFIRDAKSITNRIDSNGSTIPITTDTTKESKKINATFEEFLVYQLQQEARKDVIPSDIDEKPVNIQSAFDGVGEDEIKNFLYAGISVFMYRIYNSDSRIKKVINEGDNAKVFNLASLKNLNDAFRDGRSSDKTLESETSYIKNISALYREFAIAIDSIKEEQLNDGGEYRTLKEKSGVIFEPSRISTYIEIKRRFLKNVLETEPKFENGFVNIFFKIDSGKKPEGKSNFNVEYKDIRSRSGQIIFMAACAGKNFYSYNWYNHRSGAIKDEELKAIYYPEDKYSYLMDSARYCYERYMKDSKWNTLYYDSKKKELKYINGENAFGVPNDKITIPPVDITVKYYDKVSSNLLDELLNKNNNGTLMTINQGQVQTCYDPFSLPTFNITDHGKRDKPNATTSTMKRSGLDAIVIHYTANSNRDTDGGFNKNDSRGAIANFFVSTNVSTNNSVNNKKKVDIKMGSPHECYSGSLGTGNYDAPYSSTDSKGNNDPNKIYVKQGLKIIENKKDDENSWKKFKNLLSSGQKKDSSNNEKNKNRYSTSFDKMYNLDAFKEQANKEVEDLKNKFSLKDADFDKIVPLINGVAATNYFKQGIENSNFKRIDNTKCIAIETCYGANAIGSDPVHDGTYSMLYGGMNFVKQDSLKNLRYLVRYLMDYYGIEDRSKLKRHFDHGGKSCPYGFIGDMAWDYLKMYIGGLTDNDSDVKEDVVNVKLSEFTKFVSDYIGEKYDDPFEAGLAFAKRWNGITAAKKMEWGKELDVLTNGSICRIASQEDEGPFGSNIRDKVGEIRKVVFETLYYTETSKTYQEQGYVPAQSFYIEETTVKFYNNCEIPEENEEIIINERGEEPSKDEDEWEIGDEEEKKISINEVRSFINSWICTAHKGDPKQEKNRSIVNDAAEEGGTPQELFDVQNYYDFYSGMTPIIRAKFRALDKGGETAHWIGMNSVDHPYFKSLNIKDNGVKTATLVLYDKDFASYQLGIIGYDSGKINNDYYGYNTKTIYSLETIIKQAIGTSAISKSTEEKSSVNTDQEGSTITDDFLTFSKSKGLGPTNLRLRWGYCDANPKTSYRAVLDEKGKVIGHKYDNEIESQKRLTNWESKLYTNEAVYRSNRWYDVQYMDDGNIFAVTPSKYIKDGNIVKTAPGENFELTGSSVKQGDEKLDMSRDKQINSQNSTSAMTPWIDFMIVGLKTSLTKSGLEYTITAIESKDGELMKDRFLQKYAQVSTYPEEVLYILMSIFNEDPLTGQVRKKSPIKILLFKEEKDARAFINNELDFSNMPKDMREKYAKFTDTYTLDQAKPPVSPPSEMEKYLKKITLSFGSSEALKRNYTYDNSPKLYKSISSLLNEFCAACPPRKEKQFDETIMTEDGMEIRKDTVSEAARPLKWFTCVNDGTIYVVLYYRRALRPRIIRNYIWGPNNPYQSCVIDVSIENQNEFAILAGIQAFTEKGEKETKLKLDDCSQGAFGQGQVDVRRFQTEAPDESKQSEGENADFIFTDVKSRNMYQEAYSSSVYSGTMEILGDPFFFFDGLMQPCTYPIKLDVLIPFNGFHTLRGGAGEKNEGNRAKFESFDERNNTFANDTIYGNQRKHEISGYYVIKEIEHNISTSGYKTVLTLLSYPKIEYQILDKKDGKPVEPMFKNVVRGNKEKQKEQREVKKTRESIYFQS